MKALQATDVMTQTVVSVKTDTTVINAARAMLQHNISGLPVMDRQNRIVGMVTEGDLLRRAEIGTERHRSRWLELLRGPGRAAEEYATAHARKVAEVMSDQVVFVTPETPLDQVVELMEQHHIKRVPVVSEKGLVGIVSRANLLAALVEATPNAVPAEATDVAIRELILSEIDRQPWAPRATVNVDVKDGVVELRGATTDERERSALHIVAENVPGVKRVVDHLIWVEPLSGMVIEPPDQEPASQT
jgi:CBS domain-containing protein